MKKIIITISIVKLPSFVCSHYQQKAFSVLLTFLNILTCPTTSKQTYMRFKAATSMNLLHRLMFALDNVLTVVFNDFIFSVSVRIVSALLIVVFYEI